MLFGCLLIFFQNQLFSKNSFRNTIRVSNSSDVLSGRICVQTACIGYQQTTLVGKKNHHCQITFFLIFVIGSYRWRKKMSTALTGANQIISRYVPWHLSCLVVLAWKCHLLITSAAYIIFKCTPVNVYQEINTIWMLRLPKSISRWENRQYICCHKLTHISLMSILWDIGKQCKTRSDAAKYGVWSGSPLFALKFK